MTINLTIKYQESTEGGLIGWITEISGCMSKGKDFEELKENLFDSANLLLKVHNKEMSEAIEYPGIVYKTFNFEMKEI